MKFYYYALHYIKFNCVNHAIVDGRLFGLLPVLKGWIYLDLFSKCAQAKSLFFTVETVLNEIEDSSVLGMYQGRKDEIESFLTKLMPSQVNLEGDLCFRFDESAIVSNLQRILQDQKLESSQMPKDLGYFSAKWQCTDSIVVLLDSLQFYLPSSLFSGLCAAFNKTPASPEDLNKRLKIEESMVLAPIKPASEKGVSDENVLAPTDDYTKYAGNLKSLNSSGKGGKNHKVINNTSIFKFFPKANK